MFTQDDLRALMAETARPAVSIFLPTHIKGREIRQDPIRLKNLLDDAMRRLVERGTRPEEARRMLAPAHRLLEDELFWRNQHSGLAVYLAPGVYRCYKVAVELDEAAVVGPSFHIKPLLGLLAVDGRFLLLTISAARVRLFEGSRFQIAERTDVKLPQGMTEIIAETDYENIRHPSPVARPYVGAPGSIGKPYTFGETPEELRKSQHFEFLQRVAGAVNDILANDNAPTVLAADAQTAGHFRKIAKLRRLVPEHLDLNPDTFEPEELHRLALRLVTPHFLVVRQEALDRINMLLGNNDPRASITVEEVVKGARYGRVDTLLIAERENLWGRFDEAADAVTARGRPNGDDVDLLDYAAVQTLLQGGRVDLLPKSQMPRGALLAAIFRY